MVIHPWINVSPLVRMRAHWPTRRRASALPVRCAALSVSSPWACASALAIATNPATETAKRSLRVESSAVVMRGRMVRASQVSVKSDAAEHCECADSESKREPTSPSRYQVTD